MSFGISADDVRAELGADLVLRHYGLTARKSGSQYRLKQCPRCGEKSARGAIAVDAGTGSWLHHGHERGAGGQCSGDVLDLIAACEGLDCRRDFRRVMVIAAELACISSMVSDAERELRDRKLLDRARVEAATEAAAYRASRVSASEWWDRLPRHDARGFAYLESRGLDAYVLAHCDAVRFDRDGVAVAIRDVDGCPINVARRLYEPINGTRMLVLKEHTTRGSMVNAPSEIALGRDVVVVEGVIDSLTARLAWPDAIVLGANGAGNIARVVESAIMRVKLAGCRLLLVPHDDEAGIGAVTKAGRIALAAGLDLETTLDVVALEHKDLNDAWKAGWRASA